MRNQWFKKFGIAGFVIMFLPQIHAQDAHISAPDPAQQSIANFDPNKDVFTVGSSRISSPDLSEISGNPFLLPYFVKGMVVFANGTVYRDALLQFNLFNNQLQFLSNERPMAFAQPIKSFTLFDTTGGTTKTAWFNSGYPEYGMNKINTFYQVLAAGSRIQLLKFISKHTNEQYQYSSVPKLYFKTSEDMVIYDQQSQEMKFINNSAGSLEKVLVKINPAASQLVKATGKKKLSEDDIIGLVVKFNNL